MTPARALLPALFTAVALGCAGSSIVQQGPSDTLRAYALLLEEGRVDDAYRLLSDEAKRSISLDAFRRSVKENPTDALEIARALARPSGDPVVSATVTIPNGDELHLVFEGGRWRIDASAVDLYGQATPRQALMGFLRAFERKRYDVILRYVPDMDREGLSTGNGDAADPAEPPRSELGGDAGTKAPPTTTKAKSDGTELTTEKLRVAWEGPEKERMNGIVQALKAALPTAQIEETGDSAAMPYGAGGTVAFVREHGVWKIRDF